MVFMVRCLLTVWTERVPLDALIGQIRAHKSPLDGYALQAMMEAVLGCDANRVCQRADLAGKQLTRENALIRRLEHSPRWGG
jgi:hypothetical protein